MITIKLGKPNKLKKDEQSAFIGFDYSPETVQKVKSLPNRYYDPAKKLWEVPTADLPQVIELFKSEKINLVGTAVTGSSLIETESIDLNKLNFKTKPFNHQIEGVQYGLKHKKFLLADEQGLGKTKQAIDIAIARKEKINKCLIVVGVNSLKHNWTREVSIHSDEQARILGSRINTKGKYVDGTLAERLEELKNLEKRDEFFIITNIETFRKPVLKKGKKLTAREQLELDMVREVEKLTQNGTIGMVVVDEIHKAKNAQSKQGKALHHLKSEYKIAATGTPLMNKPIDLYNVLKWLDEERGNFFSFRGRYCVMGGYGGYEIVGYQNLSELKDRVQKVQLRRKKEEVLDLPDKIRSLEVVEMSAKQSQLYKQVRDQVIADIDEIALNPNPLAILTRLRQVTSCPQIVSSKLKENAKMDRLKEILEELAENGKKAVIFSNWTDVTDPIVKELKEYNPAVVTGKIKDRQEQVDKFQNDSSCKVIVGTIGALGTGLTLTAASTVIFIDKPWNMAGVEQAEDRAHRIGTTGTVNVITLVVRDTIDEQLEEIIAEKGYMAEALVDGKLDKLSKKAFIEKLVG